MNIESTGAERNSVTPPPPFLSILRSMIPHALQEVKFDYGFEENWKETSPAFATIFGEKGSKNCSTHGAQAANYTYP
jgi:hypothetical protein